MIFCFLWHVFCFICVSSLNLFVVMSYSFLDPCSHMLICLDLHAQGFMPFFLMFCSPFCFMLMLGLHAHMLDIMSMVMSCLDLHVCMHVLCSYAYMSRSMLSHACVLGSMFSTCFMPSSMCLRAPCHVCVLRPRPCFVMPCAIVALSSLLSFFLVFWRIGLDLVQTLWSLSLSIHQGPYQRVWNTFICMSMLLASMLYACVSLFSSRLCHA